jgi:hypothetical protein
MKVVATPEATAQLELRKSWWRANRPETADLFDHEFSDAAAIIAERPTLFAVTMKLGDREIRRVLMVRTACHLYYEIDEPAREYGPRVVAVVLTGGGHDGMQGLLE